MSAGQPITVSASIGDPQTGTIKGSTVIAAPSTGNNPINIDQVVSQAVTPSGDQPIYASDIVYTKIQAFGFVASLVSAGSGTPSVIVKLKGATGVSAVNAIYPLDVVDSTGVGTFTITIEGITTGAITYSSTAGALLANIQAALNATFGSGSIVVTQPTTTNNTTELASTILTFSGGTYAGRPIASVGVTVTTVTGGSWTVNGNSFASGTVGTSYSVTAGTAGVSADARFTLLPTQGQPNGVAFASLPASVAANITSITCKPSQDGSVVEVFGKIYVTT